MVHATTYKQGEIYIDSKRVIFPRDSGFAASAVLFGMDYENGAFVPVAVDATGNFGAASAENMFYRDQTSGAIGNVAWTELTIGFISHSVVIQNDQTLASGDDLMLSLDGTIQTGLIKAGEKLQLDGLRVATIYVKAVATKTVANYRITVW